MKKFIILIVSVLILLGVSVAADNNGDCDLFLKDNFGEIWNENNEDNQIISNLSKAMPKEAIEKAFQNLNAYCCETKRTSNCSENNSKIYPESIYLFDHLLDVYLRRLDAKEKNNNGSNLLYDLEPDLSGQEWRRFITKHGNSVKGSLPLEIKQQYDLTRKKTVNIPSYSKLYDQELEQRNSGFKYQIIRYDNWTLWDKYNFACDIVIYINKFSSDGISFSNNEVSTEEYKACKSLTDSRISNENVYKKSILMQKGNILLGSNIKSYLLSYFISNKLSELENLMFDINTSFSEINKTIPKLINQCS